MKKRLFLSVFLLIVLMMSLWCAPTATALEDPDILAKAALVVDADTGAIAYAKNEHQQLYPASLTKIMTALLVLEAVEDGKLTLDTEVMAQPSAFEGLSADGSSAGIKEGEVLTVRNLLYCMMVGSANDASVVIAEYVAGSQAAFVQMMNEKAQALGMLDTHFVNCTGLDDDPNAKDHLTSAYDIALMSRELMVKHPDIKQFTTIWMDTVRNGTFGLSNTNKLVRFYKGATGLKTGFTSAAGYCLSATAQRDGMELIAVVLGAETSQDRFQACKQLLDYGFANYAIVRPRPESAYSVPVKLGKTGQVAVKSATDPALIVDKAQLSQVDIQVQLADTVTAPVSKGQRLGTMTVRMGEQILQQIPMIATESVQKKSFWDVFVDVLRQIAMAKPKS